VRFQVEDRGPGIADGDREHALSRFGRLDNARSTPGAGLGLSLIAAVARLHGGHFELGDNAPGLIAAIIIPS
jgi:signal transduction histidine kinase